MDTATTTPRQRGTSGSNLDRWDAAFAHLTAQQRNDARCWLLGYVSSDIPTDVWETGLTLAVEFAERDPR